MITTITKSEEETESLSFQIAEKIANGGVLYLYGNLGTGKTTFTKGLAKALGIKNGLIKSPTYTYIRKYELKGRNLYHIDLYRIQDIDENLMQEIDEIASEEKNIIVIEWAEKLGEIQDHQKKEIKIKIEYLDRNSRKFSIDEL